MKTNKRLIVIGDRVLVEPDDNSNRKTKAGLYLPQGVSANDQVQSGTAVLVGPGIPMPNFTEGDMPWQDEKGEVKYMPMQVEIGDQVIFLSRFANKIEYEGKTYFIVPQSGILMVIREEIEFESE